MKRSRLILAVSAVCISVACASAAQAGERQRGRDPALGDSRAGAAGSADQPHRPATNAGPWAGSARCRVSSARAPSRGRQARRRWSVTPIRCCGFSTSTATASSRPMKSPIPPLGLGNWIATSMESSRLTNSLVLAPRWDEADGKSRVFCPPSRASLRKSRLPGRPGRAGRCPGCRGRVGPEHREAAG